MALFRFKDRLRLIRIEAMVTTLLSKENKTMATVEELNAAVAELTTAVDAAVAAIGSATGIDPDDLDAAVAAIKEQSGKLNDAVHAHQM